MSLDKGLTWFVNIWVFIVFLLNVLGIIGIVLTAPTLWAAILKIQDIYNPFNLVNFSAEVIALSPAIGAIIWRDKRRKRLLKEEAAEVLKLLAPKRDELGKTSN